MRAWALACRLEHQEPTSDEVGMQKARARALACRLEHQGPTSDEVGMQRRERGRWLVGSSIKNPPLTRWVCNVGRSRRRLVPDLLLRASYKTGSQVSSSRSYDEASLADVAAWAYNGPARRCEYGEETLSVIGHRSNLLFRV